MKCKYCNGTGEHINDANRMTTCEFCGGTGEVEVVGDSVTDVCDKCGGTGEIEVTNEDWFCLLSTEEKAKVLRRKTYGNGDENKREEKGWENWFRAEHQDNPPDIPNVPSWDEWLKEEKTKCFRCGGTDVECEFYGKHECLLYQPLTNAEYMRRCDDETLAFKIWELIKDGNADSLYHIEKWLKEKHHE